MSGGIVQNYHGLVHNVYNVNGDLVLSKDSGAGDVARALKGLRDEIAELPDLGPEERTAVVDAVDAAAVQAKAPQPDKRSMEEKLKTAAVTLEQAQSVSEKGLKLAKTLVGVGKWIAAAL